jgi:hypothetical protein
MKVFLANMHPAFGDSFALMLERAGCEVYSPDQDFIDNHIDPPGHLRYGTENHRFGNTLLLNGSSGKQISFEEFTAIRFDIVFLLCLEQELAGWRANVMVHQPTSKLVHYSGNDSVPYQKPVDYLIAADSTTTSICNPKLHLRMFPILPYDNYEYQGPRKHTEILPLVGSYIFKLEKYWPLSFQRFEFVRNFCAKRGIQVINYESVGRGLARDTMRESLLTLHFKGSEGYGYTVLESMALGIPVIIMRDLIASRTLSEFMTSDNSWIIDKPEEALDIILDCNNDRELINKKGHEAATSLRRLLVEEDQVSQLKEFLLRVVNE